MNIQSYLQMVKRHPVVQSAIPLEAEMGLPALSMANGALCVHFLFATTSLTPQAVELHAPQYHLVLTYPKGKLVAFSNLAYDGKWAGADFSAPVGSLPLTREAAEAAGRGRETTLRQLGALLNRYEEEGDLDEGALAAYRALLYRTVDAGQRPAYQALTE